MLTQNNTVSLTTLKRKTRQIINQTKKEKGPIYLFDRSSPVGVLLDLTQYNDLIVSLEDVQDAHDLLQTDLKGVVTLNEYDRKRTKRNTSHSKSPKRS